MINSLTHQNNSGDELQNLDAKMGSPLNTGSMGSHIMLKHKQDIAFSDKEMERELKEIEELERRQIILKHKLI